MVRYEVLLERKGKYKKEAITQTLKATQREPHLKFQFQCGTVAVAVTISIV